MILNIFYISTILRVVWASSLSSSKRGLIYIQSEDESDDTIWNAQNSDLTWYYNYGAYPTDGLDHSKLQFVPMLWGKPSDGDTPFNQTVKDLIDGGMNIKYTLGFNEPDLCNGEGYGGSCIAAKEAAQIWIEQVEPIKKLGVKLGAPAVTSAPSGNDWLEAFFAHCDGKCTTDFIPLHWYGDFAYLPDYVGGMHETYSNMSTVWVTEFADPDVSLEESQSFYNQSTGFFDNTSYVGHGCWQRCFWLILCCRYVTRYSYFGSFRSDASNVGPNVAMLDRGGQLTDIGAWYLGRHATGNLPSNDATSVPVLSGWMVLVFSVAILITL